LLAAHPPLPPGVRAGPRARHGENPCDPLEVLPQAPPQMCPVFGPPRLPLLTLGGSTSLPSPGLKVGHTPLTRTRVPGRIPVPPPCKVATPLQSWGQLPFQRPPVLTHDLEGLCAVPCYAVCIGRSKTIPTRCCSFSKHRRAPRQGRDGYPGSGGHPTRGVPRATTRQVARRETGFGFFFKLDANHHASFDLGWASSKD